MLSKALQSDLRRRNYSNSGVRYQTRRDYHWGFFMEPCAGRDGKPQEAAYRFDQTAAYVRSKINKNIKPN